MVKSIIRSTLSDQVYEQIKRDILFHEFPAGSKMGEYDLSAKYQVSSTPVREALKRLRSDGFLDYQPYVGHVMKKFSIKEISDLYDVRCSLETLALRQAVSHITKEDLDELEEMINHPAQGTPEQNYEALKLQHKWNEQFHNFFIVKSTNEWIAKSMGMINDFLFWVRVPLTLSKKTDQSKEEHLVIVNALRQGNVDEAALRLKEHIDRVKQDLIRFSNANPHVTQRDV